MNFYSYKTKRALFKNMMRCDIEIQEDIIIMEPNHHVKLEAWDGEGFTEKDYVKIPADSSHEKIGKALRLAFSRCTANV